MLSEKDGKISEQAKQLESAKAEYTKAIAEQNVKLEEQAKVLSDKDSKLSELAKQLDSAKAEHTKAIAENNTKLEEQVKLVADKDAKLAEASKKLAESTKQLEQQLQELTAVKQKRDEVQTWFEKRKKQALEGEEALKALQTEITLLNIQLEGKTDMVVMLTAQLEKASTTEQSLQTLFANQKEYIQQTTNALGKHIGKTAKHTQQQLQSLMGVHQQLNSGRSLPQFNDWSITPDVAQILTKSVQQEKYDLIIEFGSGVSTLVMATTLQAQNATETAVPLQERLMDRSAAKATFQNRKDWQGESEIVPDATRGYDLPKQIVTFEHNQIYFHALQKDVADSGVQHLVETIYAPLIDCIFSGQEYLFYRCEPVLQQLSRLFEGRKAKISVFVDGPNAANNSRYPSLPLILRHLGEHQIDIYLDDANREEEQQIMQQWRELLLARNVAFIETGYSTEKGLLKLSINTNSH